jgi:hypothetical protein
MVSHRLVHISQRTLRIALVPKHPTPQRPSIRLCPVQGYRFLGPRQRPIDRPDSQQHFAGAHHRRSMPRIQTYRRLHVGDRLLPRSRTPQHLSQLPPRFDVAGARFYGLFQEFVGVLPMPALHRRHPFARKLPARGDRIRHHLRLP